MFMLAAREWRRLIPDESSWSDSKHRAATSERDDVEKRRSSAEPSPAQPQIDLYTVSIHNKKQHCYVLTSLIRQQPGDRCFLRHFISLFPWDEGSCMFASFFSLWKSPANMVATSLVKFSALSLIDTEKNCAIKKNKLNFCHSDLF